MLTDLQEASLDMVVYDPPELEQRVDSALSYFDGIVSFGYPFERPVVPEHPDTMDPADVTSVDESLELEEVCIGKMESCVKITLGDLLTMLEQLNTEAEFVERTELRLPLRSIFYAEPLDIIAHYWEPNADNSACPYEKTITVDRSEYTVQLHRGSLEFALAVQMEGLNDDDNVPCQREEDWFVQVRLNDDGDRSTTRQLAEALLFEISATLGLDFALRAYPLIADEDSTDSGHLAPLNQLRDLDVSVGMPEIHCLFHKAVSAGELDYQIVGFAKVLEFVSATVVRLGGHQALRRRLNSRRALSPDAEYLDGLVALIESQRAYRKDSASLQLTLQTCCDGLLLADLSPSAIKGLCHVTVDSEEKKVERALGALGVTLAATRNSIVHAKANYKPTGEECPEEEWPELVSCAREAAIQAIRWYAEQPPAYRTTQGVPIGT